MPKALAGQQARLEIAMAKKTVTKKTAKKAKAPQSSATTKPKFPYSTKPNSLRKFLELVPTKPRPGKVNKATLRAWNLKSTNDLSIIRVLKALGLVGSNNEPTDRYTEFMSPEKGPAVLAMAIREVWAPLFEHAHEPHREDDARLRNYFNVHSGGSTGTMAYQVQTFKAACDHADFKATTPAAPAAAAIGAHADPRTLGSAGAMIHIDLHVHLPENKSRRDYEYIFEDIARHILGRDTGSDSGDKS